MPDIDPAALSRTDSNANGSATPSLSTKPLPASAAGAQKHGKPAPAAPRVDVEQVYAALKSSVGEHWNTYKDAISRFVLGYLSQAELTRLIEQFISIDANREHLHNQLICSVYANAVRDQPDQTVASWVSANDKPAIIPKPVSGDAAEHRLKVEVMQLPPRIRQRLKGVQDEPFNRLTHELSIHAQAKRIQIVHSGTTTSTLTTSATASSTAGLNNELEIRKRYTLPLSAETRDLPASSTLTDRLVPMCYEEGLPSGFANQASALDLLSTGLETFIKEAISSILGRSRTDAPVSGPDLASSAVGTNPSTTSAPSAAPQSAIPQSVLSSVSTVGLGSARMASGIMTSRYKQRLQAEEAAFARGEVKRSETGLLPVEVVASRSQNGTAGATGDVRLAWETGEPWLTAAMPWLGEKVVLGDYPFEQYGIDAMDEDAIMTDTLDIKTEGRGDRRMDGFTNGANVAARVNGFSTVNGEHDDAALDEEDVGWQGATSTDRAALSSLLDDCLAFGQ